MRVLIALLSGLLVLAGCTQIPRSGPVESVNPSSVLNETDVDFLPPGPSAGASPEDPNMMKDIFINFKFVI